MLLIISGKSDLVTRPEPDNLVTDAPFYLEQETEHANMFVTNGLC